MHGRYATVKNLTLWWEPLSGMILALLVEETASSYLENDFIALTFPI
jgi:hypothetical protein